MTQSSHEQSLAAEDEGGGVEKRLTLEDNTNRNVGSSSQVDADPEETEDEEVKVNCIGGFAGVEESDMSSDDDKSEDKDNVSEVDPEEEDSEEEEEGIEKDGVVHFVSSKQVNGLNIQRPRAILANSPTNRSPVDDDELDDDDDSSMDESSDEDESPVRAQEIGMTLEETKLEESESDDDDSISDTSSRYAEDSSSADGIAGSDTESDDSDEDDQDDEEAEDAVEEPVDEDMSDDDESASSVPLECFQNCDGPSDVAELESVLQDSRHEDQDDASATSDDSSMEDLAQDPTLQSALLCEIEEFESNPTKREAFTHAKRNLSSSALLGRALSLSSSNPAMLSPKRLCRPGDVEGSSSDEELPPSLSLGLSAFKNGQKVSLSDEDDEEQDRQLGEELRDGEEERERESTPIPLLTPPSSPLRIEGDEGDTTICEWPSNLAVDSAMAATMDLRPPSPQNLQTWEQGEEERLLRSNGSPRAFPEDGFSSSLTPMMRGISVKSDAPFLTL